MSSNVSERLEPCWTCRGRTFAEVANSARDKAGPYYRCVNCKAVYPEFALATLSPPASPQGVEGPDRLENLVRELMTAFVPTDEERAAIRELATEQDIPEQAVMRQALRLYQLVHVRAKAGEAMSFSGDAARTAEFAALARLHEALSTPSKEVGR